ncbi:sensor histidine kinase [Streptosporangium sp. NPDC023963]|uniref:sensor histidine kinase n=1 Tax=Streptosporangium sp. NPDC023963 TaxID=3155608 RepID=UPI003439C175
MHDRRLAAGALRAGRAVVLTLVFLVLASYVVAMAIWIVDAARLPEIAYAPWSTARGRLVLDAWGVPVESWAALVALPGVVVTSAGVTAAALILRRDTSWFRLYLGFVLVLFATAGSEVPLVMAARFPEFDAVARNVQGLAWIALFPVAYVFPDGRFVPGWSRWLAATWAVYLLLGLAQAGGSQEIDAVVTLILVGTCVAAQLYRYVRVSGPIEKQQAKWLMVAVGLWFVFALTLNVTPLGTLYGEASPRGLIAFALIGLVTAMIMALIPAAVAIAVLRHRLFDLDVWLNRALVYGVLTAFVVAAYAAVVGGIGALWTEGTSGVLPVAAAATVALAFSPLRERVHRQVNRLMYGERGDPYLALSGLGRQLGGIVQPEEIAPAIVETVKRTIKVSHAALELAGEVVASAGSPAGPTESFPVSHRGEALGVLIVGTPGDTLSTRDRKLLADLAGHCGAALHGALESLRIHRLAADLQKTREDLVLAREEERRRLRRDLHDSLGPALSGIALTVDAARAVMAADPAAADGLLGALKDQSSQTLEEVRRLARLLRPPVLDELGLIGALTHLADTTEQAGLTATVRVCEPRALPAAVEVAVYRIAQEAVTNVIRHSGADCCLIDLELTDHEVTLVVSDDGTGIASTGRPGVGTASMRERAEELGGVLTVSTDAGGTRVAARLPLAMELA